MEDPWGGGGCAPDVSSISLADPKAWDVAPSLEILDLLQF